MQEDIIWLEKVENDETVSERGDEALGVTLIKVLIFTFGIIKPITAVIHVYDLWINITGTRLRITHRINMFCNICLRVAAAVIQLRANNTLFKWFVLVFTGFVCFCKEWNDLFAVMRAVELNNLNNATVWRTDGVKAAASHTEYVRISPHGGLGSIHQKLFFLFQGINTCRWFGDISLNSGGECYLPMCEMWSHLKLFLQYFRS